MRELFAGIIFLVSFFAQSGKLFAQQSPMFSQYMFNTLAYNPAYAGSRNVVAATALYRNQWVGIEGAPKTGTFTIDAPFSRERIGLGAQIISDKLGITRTTGGVLSAAYRIPINEGVLAFGMQGSISQFNVSYTTAVLDPAGPGTDPVFRSDVNKTLFNVGSGMYYNTERWYAGFSVQEMLNNRLNDDSVSTTGITARQSAHAYLAAGYVFPLDFNNDYNLRTSVLVKGVKGAPIQGDFSVALWIKEMIALGVEYRTSADLSFLAELRVTPQIRFGYAYDKSLSALRTFTSGSHEFMLRYEFSFDRDKILSPRYF